MKKNIESQELQQLARDRAEAWKALLQQRAKCLRPKDKEVSELDRKVLMDALCAEQERDYLYLDSLYHIKMAVLACREPYHEGKGSNQSSDPHAPKTA